MDVNFIPYRKGGVKAPSFLTGFTFFHSIWEQEKHTWPLRGLGAIQSQTSSFELRTFKENF